MATAGPSTLPFIHYKLDITNGVRQLGVTPMQTELKLILELQMRLSMQM